MSVPLEDGFDQKGSVCVISVASQKGGVGKTTTVLSLAGVFAKLQKNVLVVDLDSQANLTISFGIDPHAMKRSISDVLFSNAPLSGVIRQTRLSGVDLVPADRDMELVDRFLPLRPDYKEILSKSIFEQEAASENSASDKATVRGTLPNLSFYDYLILDCPPGLGALTVNALIASHMLIIPTQPEYYSIYAIHGMLASVEQIRKQYNPDLFFRLLITMLDRRNRIHRHMSEKLRENYSQLLFNTHIGIDTQLRETSLAGLPITHYHNRSRSAQQYQSLAEEVAELRNKRVSKGR